MIDKAIDYSKFDKTDISSSIAGIIPSLHTLLINIDHGFCLNRSGYTAAGFINDSGRVITARHNLNQYTAVIIDPESLLKTNMQFNTYLPDTAISTDIYQKEIAGISVRKPLLGEQQFALWLRHAGAGCFQPQLMWGENIGIVKYENVDHWGFRRNGTIPQLGDSGAMIFSVDKSNGLIKTNAVGVLRRYVITDDICLFSPIIT